MMVKRCCETFHRRCFKILEEYNGGFKRLQLTGLSLLARPCFGRGFAADQGLRSFGTISKMSRQTQTLLWPTVSRLATAKRPAKSQWQDLK